MHKKGNIHDALNYRPISLTSGFSIIYEHIVFVKILNHPNIVRYNNIWEEVLNSSTEVYLSSVQILRYQW